jgi:hypothetical protein
MRPHDNMQKKEKQTLSKLATNKNTMMSIYYKQKNHRDL